MKNLFLISNLLIAFILSSCDSHKEIIFKQEKDIVFDNEDIYGRLSTFYNAADGKDYIAFSEPITQKKIRIFDENFKFVKDISTKAVNAMSTDILNAEIVSLDSIIIRTSYSVCNGCDTFYLINGQGEILTYSAITEHKTDDVNAWKYYYTWTRTPYTQFAHNTLYVPSPMTYQHRDYLSRDEESRLSFIEGKLSPLFVKVEIFNPNSKREYYFYDFYKKVSNKKDDFVASSSFDLMFDKYNMKLLAASCWSNKLFIINLNTMKLEKTIKVKSDYTPIGTTPISNNLPHSEKTNIWTKAKVLNGGIDNVYFDKYRDLYYVIVFHKDTVSKSVSQNWSLMIYDKKFKKRKEIPFLNSAYTNFGPILVVKQGILMPKKNEDDEAIFTLFSVNYAD